MKRNPTNRHLSDANMGKSALGIWRRQWALAIWLATGVAALSLPATADSLWVAETSKSMYADRRAGNVGDIITILVEENNSASKDNSTSTSKKSGVDASISSFLYSPTASGLLTQKGQMPALKFDNTTDFKGGGSINNSESIVARLAVRVIDVLPNGNLVVEGTRDTAFSGEKQTIVLRGVIRADDISANNTVYSYNVADASIRFVGKGSVSDSQKKGWFFKAWEKLTPF